MSENLLEIKNLSKSFGEHIVLSNINLSIYRGDVFGILGLSGAGKSTLIRCINGLEKFNDGEIYFYDQKVTFSRDYRKNVAMIFQQFNLLDQRTVLKNVELAGELFNDPNANLKAVHYLNLVGLGDKLDSYPSQLSGGQKQRLMIARMLLRKPSFIILDEATSSLDVETEKLITEMLNEKMVGATVIVISHRFETIRNCQRIVVLSDHTVEVIGTHESLIGCSDTYKVLYGR